MGLGALISALFICLLLALILFSVDGLNSGALFAIGLLLAAVGTLLYRARTGAFFSPLALCLTLAGLGFALIGLKSGDFIDREASQTLTYIGMTLVLYLLFPSALLRFLCAASALGLCFFELIDNSYYMDSLNRAGMAGLILVCMLPQVFPGWGKRLPPALRPALWAASLLLCFSVPAWNPFYEQLRPGVGEESFRYFLLGITLLPPALLILSQARGKASPLPALLLLAGLGLLGWLTWPGLLLAVFFLAAGQAFNNRYLGIVGTLLILAVLVFHYYNMDLTLMQKAGRMCLSGLFFLGAALLASRFKQQDAGKKPFQNPLPDLLQSPWRGKARALALLTLLSLITFQAAIFSKERLLAAGEEILLALRPVDPRSFMQGDYMDLDYELRRHIAADSQKRGYAILATEALPNGRAVGAYRENRAESDDLPQDHFAIAWRSLSNSSIKLELPPSYMFQEGQAGLFERASYAVLRCTRDGSCLLTGLADAEGKNLE